MRTCIPLPLKSPPSNSWAGGSGGRQHALSNLHKTKEKYFYCNDVHLDLFQMSEKKPYNLLEWFKYDK